MNASYAIGKGSDSKSDEYFSVIYVGFWDGQLLTAGHQPHPVVDRVEVWDNFAYSTHTQTLRLNESMANAMRSVMHKIDGKKKYTFSFLSDTIPSPRVLFYIMGQSYICEKNNCDLP